MVHFSADNQIMWQKYVSSACREFGYNEHFDYYSLLLHICWSSPTSERDVSGQVSVSVSLALMSLSCILCPLSSVPPSVLLEHVRHKPMGPPLQFRTLTLENTSWTWVTLPRPTALIVRLTRDGMTYSTRGGSHRE